MHTHRPTLGVKAHRHIDRRQATQTGVHDDFHPAMIGIHAATRNLRWPGSILVIGKQLRGWPYQKVVLIEQSVKLPVPGLANAIRIGRIPCRDAHGLLNLPGQIIF